MLQLLCTLFVSAIRVTSTLKLREEIFGLRRAPNPPNTRWEEGIPHVFPRSSRFWIFHDISWFCWDSGSRGLSLPFLKLRLPCVTHSNLSNGYSSRTSVSGKKGGTAWFSFNVCMRKNNTEPQFINPQNEHSAANSEIQGSSHYFSGQFADREWGFMNGYEWNV